MRISAVRPRSTVMATPSAMADVGQIALRRPAVPAMRQSWFDATWQALWPRGCHHSEASRRPSRECGGNSPLGLGSLRKICQLWSLRRSELSAHRPSTPSLEDMRARHCGIRPRKKCVELGYDATDLVAGGNTG